MEELLKNIGITTKGEYTKDGAYIVDIKDYNEYGKYFSLLEKSELEEAYGMLFSDEPIEMAV